MYIKSASFKNVKNFVEQEFTFDRSGVFAGWHVLVGGNASGKSTILKGIALALSGVSAGNQLMDNPSGWITKGREVGEVTLNIQPDSRWDQFRSWSEKKQKRKAASQVVPASVHWFQGKDDRVASSQWGGSTDSANGLWNPNAEGWLAMGYGPKRRLSGGSLDAQRRATGESQAGRFLTLFREDAALAESEEWLKRLHARGLEKGGRDSQGLFDAVKAFLNSGLLPQGWQIETVTIDEVTLRNAEGLQLPIRDLSDGCRAIYALMLDMLHHFVEAYGSKGLLRQHKDGYWLVDRPAVVLIDEVEAHLHPAWQQTLPEWLKTRFPQVQFIVTTHSPLIAQAADEGGVYVLSLQNEGGQSVRRLTKAEYEDLKWGRAEKILLSSVFGLQHSRSLWATEQVERWKLLNAKQEAATLQANVKLTATEKREYQSLKKQMEQVFQPVYELKDE